MRRYSRWASSSQGLFVLAALLAISAAADAGLRDTTSAIIFAVLAIAVFGRAWQRRSR
jgi:hypothetical protein